MKNRQHIFRDHINYFSAEGPKWKCLFTRLKTCNRFLPFGCILSMENSYTCFSLKPKPKKLVENLDTPSKSERDLLCSLGGVTTAKRN